MFLILILGITSSKQDEKWGKQLLDKEIQLQMEETPEFKPRAHHTINIRTKEAEDMPNDDHIENTFATNLDQEPNIQKELDERREYQRLLELDPERAEILKKQIQDRNRRPYPHANPGKTKFEKDLANGPSNNPGYYNGPIENQNLDPLQLAKLEWRRKKDELRQKYIDKQYRKLVEEEEEDNEEINVNDEEYDKNEFIKSFLKNMTPTPSPLNYDEYSTFEEQLLEETFEPTPSPKLLEEAIEPNEHVPQNEPDGYAQSMNEENTEVSSSMRHVKVQKTLKLFILFILILIAIGIVVFTRKWTLRKWKRKRSDDLPFVENAMGGRRYRTIL